MTMTIKSILLSVVMLISFQNVCLAQQGTSGQPPNIVLRPADQLILKSIDKLSDRMDQMNSELTGRMDRMNGELNGRMDQMNRELNGRIDNLWMAMIAGFIGVMGFIGALVFWDRRTFMNRAREGMRLEMAADRNCIQGLLAAMKELAKQYPQVRDALASFKLL